MSRTHLAVAGVFEIVWAVLLKSTEGFSRPLESALTIAAMIASFWFLSFALWLARLGVITVAIVWP